MSKVINKLRRGLFYTLLVAGAIVAAPIAVIGLIVYKAISAKDSRGTPTLEKQIANQHRRMRIDLAYITGEEIQRDFKITDHMEGLIYDYRDSKDDLRIKKNEIRELIG